MGTFTKIKNWLLGKPSETEDVESDGEDSSSETDETRREIDEDMKQTYEQSRKDFRENVNNAKKRIEEDKQNIEDLRQAKIILDSEKKLFEKAAEDLNGLGVTLDELDQKFEEAKKIADDEEKAKAESEAKHEEALANDPKTQDNSITSSLRSGKFAKYEVDAIQDYLDNELFETINWEQLADTLNRTKQSVKNKAKAMINKRKK